MYGIEVPRKHPSKERLRVQAGITDSQFADSLVEKGARAMPAIYPKITVHADDQRARLNHISIVIRAGVPSNCS